MSTKLIVLMKCYLNLAKKLTPAIANVSSLKTKQISYSGVNRPWLTSELMQSIKLKSKYLKLHRRERISKQINNQVRENVKKVKETKDNYFLDMINLYRSDIKKSWTELSLLLGRKKPRTSIK